MTPQTHDDVSQKRFTRQMKAILRETSYSWLITNRTQKFCESDSPSEIYFVEGNSANWFRPGFLKRQCSPVWKWSGLGPYVLRLY